jgi:hypothetical protein
MTDTAHRKDENDRKGHESHVSTSKKTNITAMQMIISDGSS